MDSRIADEGEPHKAESTVGTLLRTEHMHERLPVSTARARILKARLRLRLAATDTETHHSVLSCTHDRSGIDAKGGEDDRLDINPRTCDRRHYRM